MQRIDLSKPGERKKLIWAGILGVVAIMFLWWTFFGFGGRATPNPQRPTVAPGTTASSTNTKTKVDGGQASALTDLTDELKEVVIVNYRPDVPEARRNIFSYYEPPPPAAPVASVSTPTPTPTPPLLLAAVSPSSVYARTSDFTLEVSGDRFTPELKIYVDGRELATRYQNPQQLSALIPAAMIVNPGVRQILVRSSDGRVYSNTAQVNVAAPPTPNYSYIGIISTVHRVDTAMLQDKNNREVLTVQRGDVLGGRFRVTSISEKELVLVDTSLKIKHSLPMTEGERGLSTPSARPTPKVDTEDDEP